MRLVLGGRLKAPFGVVLLLVLSVSFSGCLGPGFKHDFTPAESPGAPTAVFAVTRMGEASFMFDGSDSLGQIINYTWDMGDGTRRHGPVVQHTYAYTNGVYTVMLTVANAVGLLGTSSQRVQAGTGENQVPRAAFTVNAWRAAIDDIVVLDSSASHDPDGDPLLYVWDANYPLSDAEYQAFRRERGGELPTAHPHDEMIEGEGHDDGDGHDDHDYGTGPSSVPQGPGVPSPIPAPVPVRPSHGSEKGNSREAFYETVGQTEENHAMLSYPMEGLYYIHLTVFDVKGDSDEEVWPLLIEANPPATEFATNWTGNVTLGSMGQNATVPDAPSGPLDENTTTVRLPFPAPTFVANVSYELHPDDFPYQVRDRVDQRIAVELRYNGERVAEADDDAGLGWIRLAVGPLEDGAVDVRVVGVVGVDIDYFVQVEATFDTNPFTPEGFLRPQT